MLLELREAIQQPTDLHLSSHLATATLLKGCKSFCGYLEVRLGMLLLLEIRRNPVPVLSKDLLTQGTDRIERVFDPLRVVMPLAESLLNSLGVRRNLPSSDPGIPRW
jgi:hypothetical protein